MALKIKNIKIKYITNTKRLHPARVVKSKCPQAATVKFEPKRRHLPCVLAQMSALATLAVSCVHVSNTSRDADVVLSGLELGSRETLTYAEARSRARASGDYPFRDYLMTVVRGRLTLPIDSQHLS